MKKFWLQMVIAFSLFLGAWLLNACGKQEGSVEKKADVTAEETEQKKENVSAGDVGKETKEALETARAYTLEQKQAHEKKVKAKLEELSGRIDELKADAEKAGAEAKAKLDEEIEELQEKQEAARKKLDELRSASGKAWEDLKSEMDDALDNLENFIKKLLPTTE